MIQGKKVLALIPARGGSKGLPRKNVLLLGGRPLLAWSILAARGSAHVDRIVVSSEDREIIETAREWGAEVPFVRPRELAADETSGMEVVLHAIEQAGQGFDYVVLVQPTSPLRTPQDIDACLERCLETGAPACVSVCEPAKSPHWMYTLDKDGRMRPLLGSGEYVSRRQDLPRVYALNGAVYAARTDWLKESGNFVTPETVGYVMDPERSLDIDTALDLRLCEELLSQKGGAGDQKVFIIAEAGVNHNGDMDLARELIRAAAEAGADAVKFQTFRAESLVVPETAKADYQKDLTGAGESQLEMLKKLELPYPVHQELRDLARSLGLVFISTPFDLESVDLLAGLGLGIIKVSSGDLTNLPLLRRIGGLGREVILSTGMGVPREIGAALRILELAGTGRENITLLHCTTAYPAPLEEANLRAMAELGRMFRVRVGFSDHTLGAQAACAAVALGARVVEKHLTLDKTLPGPDQAASAEPGEFKALVEDIRRTETALGGRDKAPGAAEAKNMAPARRSIVAARPIAEGEPFSPENLTVKRPGSGLSPLLWDRVVGCRADRDYGMDDFIVWEESRESGRPPK